MQIFIHCKTTLHVSGVTTPIIRSIKNCTRSLRYRSYYLYRYSPPTWSDRDCVLKGSLFVHYNKNKRNKQRTLPDNTIHYSTRQFHTARSYDNTPTPTEQQQKKYSDVTSKYIVSHSSKNNQTITGLIFVKW